MTISIANFKAAFNGGTRQNRFVVQGTIPYGGGDFSKFHILVTTMPAVVSTKISYDYFGRKAHYPGEKQYAPWSIKVLDDTGTNNLWKKFSNWQNNINKHVENTGALITPNSDYKAYGWTIKHLNLNGTESNPGPHKQFILDGCWPKTIDAISFNMGNANAFSDFNVVFVFDSIRIVGIAEP